MAGFFEDAFNIFEGSRHGHARQVDLSRFDIGGALFMQLEYFEHHLHLFVARGDFIRFEEMYQFLAQGLPSPEHFPGSAGDFATLRHQPLAARAGILRLLVVRADPPVVTADPLVAYRWRPVNPL